MTSKKVSFFIWFWLFVIPLSFNFRGLDPALYSKFLLVDISLLLAAILLYITGKNSYKISQGVLPFIFFYGLYILLSVISLLYYGINKADGWFVWLHLFTLPVFVVLLLLIDSKVKIQREEVSFVISCLAGCSIVIGLIQYVMEINASGWYLAASDVMRASYAHKNIFAEVMLLTLPFSLYAGFGSDRKRLLPKIISIATLFIILMLLSRAVWLGLAVATSVAVPVYYIMNKKWVPKWYHVFGIFLGLICCYFLYKWFIWHTNTGDYLAYFYSKRDTVKERKHLWSATWQIIRTYPLFGSGAGSWKILNMHYGIIGLRNYTTFFQQPHNDYLWIISEQGSIAFVAVATAWVLVIYRLVRQILARPADIFLYCLLFGLTGYGVYSAMAFPRERTEHMLIIAFITFFILAPESGKYISFPRYILWPVCMILAICAWWSGNKMTSEIHMRKYFEARNVNDVEGQRRQLSAISPVYYTLDGTGTPIAWYKGMLDFTHGDIAEASKDFEIAVAANPYHVYSLCNVGTCLNMKGDKAGAEKYFMLALDYSPGFPDAALNLCAIRFNEGRIDSAVMYLGMAGDTLTNERYVRSLNVVSQAVVRSIIDSLKGGDEDILRKKVMTLEKNTKWQADIFKKAYIYKRTIKEQVLRDILWSIKYQDHDSLSADKYQKQFNLVKQ